MCSKNVGKERKRKQLKIALINNEYWNSKLGKMHAKAKTIWSCETDSKIRNNYAWPFFFVHMSSRLAKRIQAKRRRWLVFSDKQPHLANVAKNLRWPWLQCETPESHTPSSCGAVFNRKTLRLMNDAKCNRKTALLFMESIARNELHIKEATNPNGSMLRTERWKQAQNFT